MSEENVRAKVKVLVHLEISLQDTWGNGHKIEDIHRAARQSAITRINNMVRDTNKKYEDYRIIGTPEVTAVVTSEVR